MSPAKRRFASRATAATAASSEVEDSNSDDNRGDGKVRDLESYLPTANDDEADNFSDQHFPDGMIEHLGTELPIRNGFSTSDNDAGNGVPEKHVGVVSQEELEAMNLAASDQLNNEAAGLQQQESISLLPRAKKSRLSMPTRSSARNVPKQRTFKAKGSRQDPYDLQEGSPNAVVLVPRNRADELPEISPLRNQKKAKVSRALGSESQVHGTKDHGIPVSTQPRRSPRESQSQAVPFEAGKNQDAPENHSGPQPDKTIDPPRFSRGRPRKVKKGTPGRPRKVKNGTTKIDTHIADTGDFERPSHIRDDHNEEDDSLPPAKVVPIIPRPSEIFPRNAPDILDETDVETTPPEQKPPPSKISQKRKRVEKTTEQIAKKGRPDDRRPESAEAESEPENDTSNPDLLLGQWERLQKLVKATRKIDDNETRAEVEFNDIDVLTVKVWIKKARTHLEKLRDDSRNIDQVADPPEELKSITLRIEALCGKDPQSPADFEDQEKSEQIYVYLIPRMVRFVVFCAKCYMTIDQLENTSTRSVTTDHLHVLSTLAESIGHIGNVIRGQYTRPRAHLKIFNAVHNNLIVPLRSIHKVWTQHLAQLRQSQFLAAQRRRMQEEATTRRRNEETRRAFQQQLDKLDGKFKDLHEERRVVEGFPFKYEKMMHLTFPGPEPELDGDGDHFVRENIFRPRIGPPPFHVQKARDREWSESEVAALIQGLEHFAGPMVFERIFRHFCRKGGVLNKYNVTEIVTIAADAKEWLQGQEGEEVAEWVKMIPEWTKPHVLLGQENE